MWPTIQKSSVFTWVEKKSMLDLQHITVRYGNRMAITDLSLTVASGEIVTLMGANGAGKSTTLKAISGLLRPSQGEIYFQGERIDHLPPHEIIARGLSHVPEGRLLFKDMSVLEHLELGAIRSSGVRGTPAQTLEWVYTLFPILKDRSAQKAGTLSGGQQQMLAIARGLMAQPSLLMLDEPSLGLAPIVVDTLADIITHLHQSGIVVLLVEQRVDMALQISHRGYVMETGAITVEGPSADLLQNPSIKEAYLGI